MGLRYIIVSPQWGVYVGTLGGYSFWTKKEPGGSSCVYAFETPEDAYEHAGCGIAVPTLYSIEPVECATGACSLWELERAGFGRFLGDAVTEYLQHVRPEGRA